MQAITTKFLCCTNYRESRIKATCEAGSLTLGYDHGLNEEENHHACAVALTVKLGWDTPHYGKLITGGIAGAGYCHVFSREIDLASQVMGWVKTPGDHGGNPYRHQFVKTAERILGME